MINDELWEQLAGALPGMPWGRKLHGKRDRAVFEVMAHLAVNGGHWFDVPSDAAGPSGLLCWRRYLAWRDAGAWADLWRALHAGLLTAGHGIAPRVPGHAVVDMAPASFWASQNHVGEGTAVAA